MFNLSMSWENLNGSEVALVITEGVGRGGCDADDDGCIGNSKNGEYCYYKNIKTT